MSADRLQEIMDWLVDGARSAAGPAELVAQLCERLVDSGVPIWRVGVFVRTLHPDVFGRSYIWRLGKQVEEGAADFSFPDTEEFQTSPLHTAIRTTTMVRHRLTQNVPLRSLVLEEMRAEGITDYLAFPLVFTDGSVHATSMQTKELAGFAEAEIDVLGKIVPLLARLAEVRTLQRTAITLLDTYVGNRTGARILAGQIRRGDAETLHAAIWLSDLRGFTALSDRLPPRTVVDLLNRYFDCQVPSILKAGGEVLKFMGDGLLAVFPTADDGSDEREICAAVLVAAREARAAIKSLGCLEEGSPAEAVNFGLALHVGDVLYGNIGGRHRLDFTCIGPAVNLAARLEKLTGGLGRNVLASPEFASHTRGDWMDIGEFAVPGFARPQRVFGLRDESGGVLPAS
ncbi:adenylate/guanylate cyclase domain-containing protein [Bradyrhizobium sp. LHD-71]|uniref:adenylate/guanylate cyclase domain-containing protein n=1 Tax=Bradyrhizobium sp. LHD-71 TaxID=3072141 RepID=UPI00280F499D|nr:adenylate/guanylate cyclase domain-containing protein [Bradyrhizobium sp. LHD-71]MDQ8726409.1 adenylate/guanylate cyclase domain-containing protein [Bradyrhizobium sp. LHD-71]